MFGIEMILLLAYSERLDLCRIPRVSFAFAHFTLGYVVCRHWRQERIYYSKNA